jgi:hypothetical protein
MFSTTAAGFSSTSFLANTASLSKVGVLGETLGETFYYVAKEANKIALARDTGQPIFRFGKNKGPAAFIVPSSNKMIVYKTIITSVGLIVTVYGYKKFFVLLTKKVPLFS